MLRQRILSALVLAPLLVAAVLLLDDAWFALAMLVVVLLAAWEWGALVPLPTPLLRSLYIGATALLLVPVWHFAGNEGVVDGIFYVTLAWWLLALAWISHPAAVDAAPAWLVWVKALAGWLAMASTWLALVVLHARPDHGPWWVLFALALVWAADIGAYFAGRRWGRRKLAPTVSPGKTWEGVYGALSACTLYALLAAWAFDIRGMELAGFLLVCLVAVLFSVVGDLFESLLKRQRGVKDSGTLIPGHGGLLDRVDSLLAALPVFALGLRWVDL